MTTLGEVMAVRLQVAVDLGYITAKQRDDWVGRPPRNAEEAEYRRFVLRLVRVGE